MIEALILIALIVIAEEGARYARKIVKALDTKHVDLKANTDAMEELRRSIDVFTDEVRGVQTYGLRIQK